MSHPCLPFACLLLAAAPALAQDSEPAEPSARTLPAPIALALELRAREDPAPLRGKDLNRYLRRQFLFPSRGHSFDTDPALVRGLAGAGGMQQREVMPEFVAAEYGDAPTIHWHLLNAIYMNAHRLRYYSDRAGPLQRRARRLSRLMIIGEAVSLPRVKRWDQRAAEIRQATGVDFVHHMRPLNPLPPQTPPVYRGVATREQRRQVKRLGKQLREDLKQALAREDLREVSDLVFVAVNQLIAWEREWGVHWHMSRHTIGSIGFTAIRGEEHADAPGMTQLTLDYLGTVYKHTIGYGRKVDRMAQPLHQVGSGMVVNEFTDTSFLAAYAARELCEAREQASKGLVAALRR